MSCPNTPRRKGTFAERRALIACTRCRGLKKKCRPEGSGCQKCNKAGHVCHFVPVSEEKPSPHVPVTSSAAPSMVAEMPHEDTSNVSPLDAKQLSQWPIAPQGILYSPTHNSNYVAYDDFCYPSNNFPQLCSVREDMVLFTSEPAQCTSDQTPPPQANIPVDVYGMFEPYNALDNQHNTGPTQPCISFGSYEDVTRFETSPTSLTMYDQYTSDSSYYACSLCSPDNRCVVHSEKSDYPG